MKQVISLLCLVLLSGCADKSLEHKVEKMIGRQIVFPENLQPVIDGRPMPNTDLMSANAKLFMWYDSTGCTTCKIKQHMEKWYDMVDYANKIGNDKLKVVFLFTPKITDIIEPSLRAFKYPVYIDKGSEFSNLNSDLPEEEFLHSFLLDKDNKIVLVGNPLLNESLGYYILIYPDLCIWVI